jgi:hypothetical protein
MKRLRPYLWRIVVVAAAAGLLPVIALIVAPNSSNSASGSVASDSYQLLAKAQPDECFNGIGNPYPAGPPCAEGQPKVNQAYVWGLTQAGDNLWFGTGANVNCLVQGHSLGIPTPELTDDWVCEFGESQIVKEYDIDPSIGDFRPPEVYSYDTTTNTLTDRTQQIRDASQTDSDLLDHTLGMRSAGSLNGVAFFGGPGMNGTINMFAFDTDTGAYLGSHTFSAYSNIRHFVTADGVLYAGVALSSGSSTSAGGRVLRWTGDKSNPFQFEEVGDLPDQVAELTTYDNHLVINTWPSTADSGTTSTAHEAGVWMSPTLPDGGLTPDDANSWTELWKAGDYEPDSTIAGTYGGGALMEYKGYLYFGTMNVPMRGTVAITSAYPPADDQQAKADLHMSQRTISIWRMKDVDSGSPTTDLLYGASKLPAYDPSKNDGKGGWSLKSTGWTPKYGSSGFGNFWNNYTWTMGVSNDKLYIGTMDWSLLEQDLVPAEAKQLGIKDTSKKALKKLMPQTGHSNGNGADLWEFSSNDTPARAVATDGVGNYLNYGIRTMVVDGSTLYLGMADPMNLDTSTTDDKPEGGWELIKVNTGP